MSTLVLPAVVHHIIVGVTVSTSLRQPAILKVVGTKPNTDGLGESSRGGTMSDRVTLVIVVKKNPPLN